MNATDLYARMIQDIRDGRHHRKSEDNTSPTKDEVSEATVGRLYVMEQPMFNVPMNVSIDLRWAVANVLYFFAATEEHADLLRKYNKKAERFLEDDKWRGAYGAIAVPQIQAACMRLQKNLYTRRAIVSMGRGDEKQTINNPACWSFLQFLVQDKRLDMLVTQRSLLLAVMPYDCVLLSNIFAYVAKRVGCAMGKLHWFIGSLHAREPISIGAPVSPMLSVMLPAERLACSSASLFALMYPSQSSLEYREWLLSPTEVRS